MNFPKINRRKFIAAILLATPGAVLADAKLLEPVWVKIRHQKIGDAPTHRCVHFSDLHHKGDRKHLESVVKTINALAPDFICFTGDIIEDEHYLPEALEILADIRFPMFGVPGNHDYWSGISFAPVIKCFAGTGGAWLMDEARVFDDGKINIIGTTCSRAIQAMQPVNPAQKNILLMHYPAWAKKLGHQKFDVMLAGHSHGGQVRIPFYGAPLLPFGVDEFDLGLFQTPAGPLHVNPGIGYIGDYNFRFNCRPEITVIEI